MVELICSPCLLIEMGSEEKVSLLFLFPPAFLLAGPCVFLNLDLTYVNDAETGGSV